MRNLFLLFLLMPMTSYSLEAQEKVIPCKIENGFSILFGSCTKVKEYPEKIVFRSNAGFFCTVNSLDVQNHQGSVFALFKEELSELTEIGSCIGSSESRQ